MRALTLYLMKIWLMDHNISLKGFTIDHLLANDIITGLPVKHFGSTREVRVF